MSDRYKILSQVEITSLDEVPIYTVPTISDTSQQLDPEGSFPAVTVNVSPASVSINTQTLLTSMVFAFGGTGAYVSGHLKLNDGAAGSATSYLMKSLVFYNKQNSILEISMPLPPGSTLYFEPTAYTIGNLYITAFGIELETGYGPS